MLTSAYLISGCPAPQPFPFCSLKRVDLACHGHHLSSHAFTSPIQSVHLESSITDYSRAREEGWHRHHIPSESSPLTRPTTNVAHQWPGVAVTDECLRCWEKERQPAITPPQGVMLLRMLFQSRYRQCCISARDAAFVRAWQSGSGPDSLALQLW